MPSAITENIVVTVKSVFQEAFSDPDRDKFAFSYRIEILNDSPFSIQLLKRHWFIVDSNLNKREVEGDGVVGETPVLHPGQKHGYESWCPLATDIGLMYGFYTFRRLEDGHEFKVRIPMFQLIPPYRLN